jgi:hypothetical protein
MLQIQINANVHMQIQNPTLNRNKSFNYNPIIHPASRAV